MSLVRELDLASKRNVEYETKMKEAEKKNYEYSTIINELDMQINGLLNEKRRLIENYKDLSNEHDYLKKSIIAWCDLGYDHLFLDFDKSLKENVKKDEVIQKQSDEISDMRSVIGKLTEVRVILNKYFSINFENFR